MAYTFIVPRPRLLVGSWKNLTGIFQLNVWVAAVCCYCVFSFCYWLRCNIGTPKDNIGKSNLAYSSQRQSTDFQCFRYVIKYEMTATVRSFLKMGNKAPFCTLIDAEYEVYRREYFLICIHWHSRIFRSVNDLLVLICLVFADGWLRQKHRQYINDSAGGLQFFGEKLQFITYTIE